MLSYVCMYFHLIPSWQNRDIVDYYAITVKVSNNDTTLMKNVCTLF